jgi:hypothetical protein
MKELAEKEFLFWAIKQSISGVGSFTINKEIKKLVIYISNNLDNNDESNKYIGKVGDKIISYTDINKLSLTNDIYVKIVEGNLMSKLQGDVVYKYFLNSIVLNVLRNMKRDIDNRKRILSDLKKDINEDFNNSFMSRFFDPEVGIMRKEMFSIIKNNTTEQEYLLLSGEISLDKFSKLRRMPLRTAERYKNKLAGKLLIILNKSGYTNII